MLSFVAALLSLTETRRGVFHHGYRLGTEQRDTTDHVLWLQVPARLAMQEKSCHIEDVPQQRSREAQPLDALDQFAIPQSFGRRCGRQGEAYGVRDVGGGRIYFQQSSGHGSNLESAVRTAAETCWSDNGKNVLSRTVRTSAKVHDRPIKKEGAKDAVGTDWDGSRIWTRRDCGAERGAANAAGIVQTACYRFRAAVHDSTTTTTTTYIQYVSCRAVDANGAR